MQNNLIIIKQINLDGKAEKIQLTKSYGMHVLQKWLLTRNKSFDEEIANDIIIKIILDDDYNKAMDKLKNGYEFNDTIYVPLITTTGMMKKEDDIWVDDSKIKGQCEYLFIKKDYEKFTTDLMNIMSAGLVGEKLSNQEKLFINKDVIARVSLAFSSCDRIQLYNWIDHVVVLPETTYEHIATYQRLDMKALDRGEVKLKPPAPETCEFSFSDGCGLASDVFFDAVSKVKNYRVDYAVIRLYPLAVKGVVYRFNWNKYFNDFYTTNTDNFKKENGVYYVKDRWGNWADVSNAWLILSDTQAKWAKWFKSLDDVKERLKKYSLYQDENINSVYVGRVNSDEHKEYTKCNYQLLNVLNCTPNELKQLAEYDLKMYQSMTDVKNYNIDRMRINLGDCSKKEVDAGFTLGANTKYHKLLQSDEQFYGLAGAKKTMVKNIKKSSELLAGGKFYVHGAYKTQVASPVDICNFMLTGKVDAKLTDKNCYVRGQQGDYVIARNPIAGFYEVQKVKLVHDELLDKYLPENFTDEIIFLPASNVPFLLSGSDMDGDESILINNEIIYNSVIDTVPIFNAEDGKKGDKLPFTMDNMYKSVILGSGAIINSIASTICRINTMAQDIPYELDGKYYTKRYLCDLLYHEHKEEIDKNIKNQVTLVERIQDYNTDLLKKRNKELSTEIKTINKLETLTKEDKSKRSKCYKEIESNNDKIKTVKKVAQKEFDRAFKRHYSNSKDLNNLPEAEIKALITARFEELKPYIALGTVLSMQAIDIPKTLLPLDKNHKKLLKSCLIEYNSKGEIIGDLTKDYPIFVSYTKDYADIDKNCDLLNRCPLNQMAQHIKSELLDNLEEVTEKVGNAKDSKKSRQLLQETIAKGIVLDNIDSELEETMSTIKNKFMSACRSISCYKNQTKIKETWSDLEDEINQLLESFTDMSDQIRHLCKKLDYPAGLIVNMFWSYLEPQLPNDGSFYLEHGDGEIEYMHKKYKKISCKLEDLF